MTCADAKRLFPDCWEAVLEAEAAWGPEVWEAVQRRGFDANRVISCLDGYTCPVCPFHRPRHGVFSSVPKAVTAARQLPNFKRYIGGKLGLC